MVTTGCEFERPFHVDWLVSMHQKKLPTVWRIASTMSGPEAAADTVFGPKKYWPHFNPAPMALIPIHRNKAREFYCRKLRGSSDKADHAPASLEIGCAHKEEPQNPNFRDRPAATSSLPRKALSSWLPGK